LLLQSEDFTTTWGNTGTSDTANTEVAPNGTTTADTLTANNDLVSGNARIEQGFVSVSGTTYTASIFVKNGTINYLQLHYSSSHFGVNGYANFDLTGAGALGTVGSDAKATITALTNGFFRITITAPCTTNGNAVLYIQMISSSTAARSAAITRSGQTVILWGAQLEAGAFPTSYIPTTTTALTRNADAASMTGTNFSGWYNAAEGTLFAQAQSFQTTGVFSTQVISDGTTPNEMRHSSSSLATSPTFVVNVGGVSQASLAVSLAITLPYKIASRYAVDDFRSAVNGTLSAADTSGTIPTVDRLTIGARGNSTLFLNGWIARLAYYPTKLGDSQLHALTV
jgi:uncharacterized lipoprotein NlpE involved in copper resistance